MCGCMQHLNNMAIQEIDTSNGVMFPFYDPDCSVIYLCGRVIDDALTTRLFILPDSLVCCRKTFE